MGPGSNFPEDLRRTVSVIDVANFPDSTAVPFEYHTGFPHMFTWSIAFAPDSRSLRLVTKPWGHVRTWSLTAQQWGSSDPLGGAKVLSFEQSPDGRKLAAVLRRASGKSFKHDDWRTVAIKIQQFVGLSFLMRQFKSFLAQRQVVSCGWSKRCPSVGP